MSTHPRPSEPAVPSGTPRLTAHIPGLDGLRALACLAVFGVHWQQFTGWAGAWGPFDLKRLLENGNTGVSLFFTLSAFLLSIRFWTGSWGRPGEPWVRRYVLSRATRILPAYYTCVLALVVLTGPLTSPRGLADAGLHFAFVHNFWERSFYSLSPPFWTIAVQVQSYVLMPILLLLVLRSTGRFATRAWVLGGLTVASYLVHWASLALGPGGAAGNGMTAWAAGRPTVATHSVLAHAPHFLLGLLAGLVYVRRVAGGGAAAGTGMRLAVGELSVWLAALVILVILATPLDDWFSIPYGRYNLPVVPLLITWIILEAPRTRLARWVLDAAPLRLLGVISYGVYVYHYPGMQAVQKAMEAAGLPVGHHWAVFAAASLALAIIVSALSFRLLEAPLARVGRRRPSGKTTPAPAPG